MDDAVASSRPPSTADTGAGRACALVAVLAGGLATRMGTAKASVDLCGRPLISYRLGAVRAAGLEPVVVAKRASRLPPLRDANAAIHSSLVIARAYPRPDCG
jgi:CTP:molybdopterin cytidylyltransferase MocA